ncbi:cyclin-dependent kinase D-2, partial [Nephila pilipes]
LVLANLYLGKGFYLCTVKNQKAGQIEAVVQYTGLFQCQSYIHNFFTQTYPNSKITEARIEEVMSLIDKFLQINPESRIATEEALQDDFFSSLREETKKLSPSTSGISAKKTSSFSADTGIEKIVSQSLDMKILQQSTGHVKPIKNKWQKYKYRLGKLKLSIISSPIFKTEKSKAEELSKIRKTNSSTVFFIK